MVTRWQMLAVFLLTAAAFAVLAWRTEIQQRQLDANTRRLTAVVHQQCVIADAAAKRQIELLDAAIAAERRRPVPDMKRIADLEQFKPSRLNCGRRP